MSYKQALEAAGAVVMAFKEFGSWQGDWWAFVGFKGKRGWVNGSYGSCSGCDAFQAEFGFEFDHDHDIDCCYNPIDEGPIPGCERCAEAWRRLVDFGRKYLDDLMSQENAIKQASKDLEWDGEGQEAVDFIKENEVLTK